ncbi:hypothetical protein D3C78_1908050 [compost metagenome]
MREHGAQAGDAERAAHRAEELDQGGHRADMLARNRVLDGQDEDRHGDAQAEADHDHVEDGL